MLSYYSWVGWYLINYDVKKKIPGNQILREYVE